MRPAATGPGPHPQRHHQAEAGVVVAAIVPASAKARMALRPKSFIRAVITVPPSSKPNLRDIPAREFAEIP
jgi:hypothetical protein